MKNSENRQTNDQIVSHKHMYMCHKCTRLPHSHNTLYTEISDEHHFDGCPTLAECTFFEKVITMVVEKKDVSFIYL